MRIDIHGHALLELYLKHWTGCDTRVAIPKNDSTEEKLTADKLWLREYCIWLVLLFLVFMIVKVLIATLVSLSQYKLPILVSA